MKGFLIYEEMQIYFPIYEKVFSHIWLCNCSTLNFFIYEESLIFFFISVQRLYYKRLKSQESIPNLAGQYEKATYVTYSPCLQSL
jgi:hypothetical protein